MSKIFSDVEIIRKINEAFLEELEKEFAACAENGLLLYSLIKRLLNNFVNPSNLHIGEVIYDNVMIGKVFARRAPTFKLYSNYINQYYVARELLKKQIEANPQLAQFLQERKLYLKSIKSRNIGKISFLLVYFF